MNSLFFWKSRVRLLTILLGAAALSGCSSNQSNVPLNSYQNVPAATATSPTLVPSDYRISSLDQLRIDVFGEPDLSLRELPVSPTGTISMPMVGTVVAEGRTTSQLAHEIATGLNRYLRRPQVAVNVTEFNSQQVTVEGAVRTPGVYRAIHQMSLMETLALGQGLTDGAKSDQVLVFRQQGSQRYVARFDVGAIQNGTASDPSIIPGDIVVVGFSASRRFFQNALAVLPATVGIFIALLN